MAKTIITNTKPAKVNTRTSTGAGCVHPGVAGKGLDWCEEECKHQALQAQGHMHLNRDVQCQLYASLLSILVTVLPSPPQNAAMRVSPSARPATHFALSLSFRFR